MYIIGILLVLAALLILAPIRVVLRGRLGDREDLRLVGRLGLVAGLAGAELGFSSGTTTVAPVLLGWAPWRHTLSDDKKPTRAKPGKAPGKKRSPSAAPGLRDRLARMRLTLHRASRYYSRLRGPLFRFLRRIRRSIRLRKAEGEVVFGFEDPAVTGQVYGYGLAASSFLGPRFAVHLAPDFRQARVGGRVELVVRIWLALVLWALFAVAIRLGLAWVADRRAHKRALRQIDKRDAARAVAA